ncbi:MAG: EAL domain-containing protein [Sphingomonadaceae bacterium]
MRVLTCLAFEHDLSLVFLAIAMCLVGSYISVTLFSRALRAKPGSRMHWIFLAAVMAGAGTWATHFIAMLGYEVAVPIRFDGTLTIVSFIIAVVGMALGLAIAIPASPRVAAIGGGGVIGLSIAAMHYTGMFAYRAEGLIEWLPGYVIASIVLACAISMGLIHTLKTNRRGGKLLVPTATLASAIVMLHFVGMAAFVVTPMPGVDAVANGEVWTSMASAVAVVALLVLGTGVSTHLVEQQTFTRSQDELVHIAMHDALTRLANRHHFTEALNKECHRLVSEGAGFALLMVDLDRFKPINDTFGHPAGDEVLRKVAERLRRAVREDDLIARIGGDEFAIILRNIDDQQQVEGIAARIVDVLRRPFLVKGAVAEMSGSVGIAFAPQHGDEVAELVQHADLALYSAKDEGRERYNLFHPDMMDKMKHRRSLEADLRRAVTREDFTIVYQPVVDARSGRIVSAEALLRWSCDERGEVPPSLFIPIAEELGLVSHIGSMVLRGACMDAASWDSETSVAVNISPVQLIDPRLPQIVQQALDDSGLDPQRLELEITETALLGNDEVAFRTLTRLREIGAHISLDDFGTGYSSLSYLHRFPIDRIKIDKSFVQRLPHDSGSASIVGAIAQLGSSFDLKITAEGIETEEQLRYVSEQGCHHLQGFLISRPVRCHQLADLLGSPLRLHAA